MNKLAISTEKHQKDKAFDYFAIEKVPKKYNNRIPAQFLSLA